MSVIQNKARYAGCGSVLSVIPTERPLCRCGTMLVWSAHATHNPSNRSRSAEHGIAVDRFAREIGGFLKVVGSALAATECQTVGPGTTTSFLLASSLLWYTP